MKDNNNHPWRFVEKYFPDYYHSDTIAHADDLSKLVDGEINGAAENLLHSDYDGDENNPQIQIDYDALHREIYEAAIINFLEQQRLEEDTDKTFKVLNIAADNFTEDFLNKIESRETYQDRILKENLYSPDHIVEELQLDGEVLPANHLRTLQGINEEMQKYNCTYFRIIEIQK